MPDLVDEEELQLSDFSITDLSEEDLFPEGDVEPVKNYMNSWWGNYGGDWHPNVANGNEEG